MFVLVTCKNEEEPINGRRQSSQKIFQIRTIWELSVAIEIRNPIPSGQTLCNQSPTQMMLDEIDFDWPADLRDIHVWKC